MKNDSWNFFDMTLMIPDIHGVNGEFTATGFECKNNFDHEDSVALCATNDEFKSSLTLVVTLNGNNNIVTGIFNDLMSGVHYEIHTDFSKADYSFVFSIFIDGDVPMKIEALSTDGLSPKAIPIIGVNNRNEIVNQNRATVARVGQSDVGIVSQVLCLNSLLFAYNNHFLKLRRIYQHTSFFQLKYFRTYLKNIQLLRFYFITLGVLCANGLIKHMNRVRIVKML